MVSKRTFDCYCLVMRGWTGGYGDRGGENWGEEGVGSGGEGAESGGRGVGKRGDRGWEVCIDMG